MLLGRRSECETLDRLLDCVGAGESRTLVLVGLKDRATALGGRLEVESPAGGGTVVAAQLPLG